MSKTVKEWLMELPDGYRERALKNTPKGMLDAKRPTMSEAIHGAFIWLSTRENYDFWSAVHDHYAYDTPLPPLPQSPNPLKSNEQIFDDVANNVMAEYDPAGFRKKFKTLHKAIMISMETAAKQHKNA
jgi:hypothetical protein